MGQKFKKMPTSNSAGEDLSIEVHYIALLQV